MTTNNHPAHGPVSLDRLHQMREILSKATAQSDGGNLGYAMADAVKVIDGAIAERNAKPVPCPKCNDTGMADSGGVQPWGEPILIECDCRAAMLQGDHRDLSYPVDPQVSEYEKIMQHAIQTAPTLDSDGKNAFPQRAMQSFGNSEQLIKHPSSNQGSDSNASGDEIKQPSSNCTIGVQAFIDAMIQDEPVSDAYKLPTVQIKPVADLYGITSPTGSETTFTFDAGEASSFVGSGWHVQEYVDLERYQEVMVGNSPVTPDGWIPVSERKPNDKDFVWCWGYVSGWTESDGFEAYYDATRNKWWTVDDETVRKITHWMPLPAAPQQEVKSE